MKRAPVILMLGLLMTVSPISIDMYLPAFAQMASALHGTVAQVALSLTSYFVGLTAGQLFYGPLLDRFGRRRPVLAGLMLYLLACVGCFTAHAIETLIVWRFFQALGGCVAQVGAMAMVRDFFPPADGAKIFSMLMLVLGVSPLLAPSVGSFVVAAWGWQAVFVVLFCATALITGVVALWLPEGHAPDPSISLRPGPIFAGFRSILANRAFATYAIAGAFSFAGLFVYVTASPLIFMTHFHATAQQYGAIFAFLSVGFIGSSQVNILVSRRVRSETVFAYALVGQCVAGVLLLATSLTGGVSLLPTIAIFFLYLSSLGIASPNASAVALAPFDEIAGSAAALLGFIQIGAGAIASAGVGLPSAPIAVLLCVSSFIAGAIVLIGRARGGIVTWERSAADHLH